jgi:hypothetical protein
LVEREERERGWEGKGKEMEQGKRRAREEREGMNNPKKRCEGESRARGPKQRKERWEVREGHMGVRGTYIGIPCWSETDRRSEIESREENVVGGYAGVDVDEV